MLSNILDIYLTLKPEMTEREDHLWFPSLCPEHHTSLISQDTKAGEQKLTFPPKTEGDYVVCVST